MTKCPKCCKDVSFLRWSENAVRFGTFDIDDDYLVDSTESSGNDEFCCPDCDEVLFTKEEDARRFLSSC